jgi:hypothetical protein
MTLTNSSNSLPHNRKKPKIPEGSPSRKKSMFQKRRFFRQPSSPNRDHPWCTAVDEHSERECAWCGNTILDYRRKYYCSKDCHQAAQDHVYWDRRPQKARERYVYPKICHYCQNEFLSDRRDDRNGRIKYCSVSCRNKSCRDDSFRVCPVCGTRFEVARHQRTSGELRRSERKTCSKSCANKLGNTKNPIVLAVSSGRYMDLLKLVKERSVPQRLSPWFDDECWVWQGSRDTRGYASGPRQLPTTLVRCICELRLGMKLGSQSAHHTCGMGSSACVRPSHIVPATQAANMAEMLARQSLEARIRELTAALEEEHPNHPLLQLVPVVT